MVTTGRPGCHGAYGGLTHGQVEVGSGHRGASWWRFDEPRPAVSSGSVGGGLGPVSWVLNISVDSGYDRTDLDAHAAEVAGPLGLTGRGTALFTAVPGEFLVGLEECDVRVWSTVGVTRPTWPADRTALVHAGRPLSPGTINTVVVVPVAVTESALVALALTAAEAKAQACVEHGVPGTGTASDAVVVVAAGSGVPEEFGGVRSRWGARVALAVHAVTAEGLRTHPPVAWMEPRT